MKPYGFRARSLRGGKPGNMARTVRKVERSRLRRLGPKRARRMAAKLILEGIEE